MTSAASCIAAATMLRTMTFESVEVRSCKPVFTSEDRVFSDGRAVEGGNPEGDHYFAHTHRAVQLHVAADRAPYGGPGLKPLSQRENHGVTPPADRSCRTSS
jgi:hypothetical protein